LKKGHRFENWTSVTYKSGMNLGIERRLEAGRRSEYLIDPLGLFFPR